MKTPTIVFAAALVAATTLSIARADTAVGVRDIAVAVPERGHGIAATLWYPAVTSGAPVEVGGNGVFKGVSAYRDAPVAAGQFPVIVLSHGGLRTTANAGSWLASRLAAKGFVVAVPHPPGPQHLAAEDAPAELWLRPADMSAALTALEHDSNLAGGIDADNAGALGLLLGGTSALELAGARLDGEAYAKSCDGPTFNPDCMWLARHNVDLHKIDVTRASASLRDRRFTSVVAVAPELAELFAPKTMDELTVPVLHVGLNDAQGDGIAGADFKVIATATRFDLFNECQPKGRAILREEGGDEELCADGLQPRAAVHDALAELIASTFRRQLAGLM